MLAVRLISPAYFTCSLTWTHSSHIPDHRANRKIPGGPTGGCWSNTSPPPSQTPLGPLCDGQRCFSLLNTKNLKKQEEKKRCLEVTGDTTCYAPSTPYTHTITHPVRGVFFPVGHGLVHTLGGVFPPVRPCVYHRAICDSTSGCSRITLF